MGVDKVRPQKALAAIHRSRMTYGYTAARTFTRGNLVVSMHEGTPGGGSFASVATKAKPNDPIVSVPTDKSGNIPKDLAILRLLDEREGSRTGRKRSALVDVGVEADQKAPRKAKTDGDRLAQYLWYMHPNESDLAKIDTSDASWAPPKVDGKRGPAVAIVGARSDEMEAIRKAIDDSFTQRERRLMRGLVIEIRKSAGRGVNGYYQKAVGFGNTNFDQIVIARGALRMNPPKGGPQKGRSFADSTLVHEVIHFLRAHDKKRTGVTKRPKNIGRDRDIEETFTDGETIARMKMPPWSRSGGYYPGGYVEREVNMTHDRMLVQNIRKNGKPAQDPSAMRRAGHRVTRDGRDIEAAAEVEDVKPGTLRKMWKSKKGLPAVKTVEARFPDMKISKAQLTGHREAVDTYWRLKKEGQTIETHIYSAHDTPNTVSYTHLTLPTILRV